MTIWELQSAFRNNASILGDYQSMSKTDLANGYCDADEAAIEAKTVGDIDKASKYEVLRSAYYSALMLRYWYKIFDWQRNSSTLNLYPSDFVDWLSDSLYVAFYYRAWRYEYEAIVKEGRFVEYKLDENGNKIPNRYYYKVDPNAPDKIINRCCASMRGRVFQFYNKDKRKVDTQSYSLDAMVESEGDYAIKHAGAYTSDSSRYTDGAYVLIQTLLDRGENLEALIVDSIAYYDTYKQEKNVIVQKKIDEETGEEINHKYVSISNRFDPRKLVKHLNNIDEQFILSFCKTYNLSNSIGHKILDKLKSLTNVKLYKIIEKTLEEIRQSPALLEHIY